MTRRLRVLVLCQNFPPGRGSGVYRARAWANHLARRGHDVSVVTVRRQYHARATGTVDQALAATVDPAVRVLEAWLPSQFLEQDVHRLSWAHASFPDAYDRLWQRLPRWFFPERYGHVYPLLAWRGLRSAWRGRPDVVVVTGNPYAQLAAGRLLARLLRARLVVDFHDAWTLDQYGERDAFPRDGAEWTWEKRVVDASDWLVTVNEPLAQWYGETYPQAAVRVVENGFAEEVVPDLGYLPAVPGRPLRVGYVGTVRKDLPLEELRAAWTLARQDPRLAGASFTYVGYLGFFGHQQGTFLARMGVGEDDISYAGPVPQTELAATLHDLDILALLTPSSRYVTAGKVYDYMAAGRPVAGLHDPRNDTTRAFEDYPLFAGATGTSPKELADALLRAADLRRGMDEHAYAACRAEALRHTWDAVLAPLVDEVEAGCRG